jgi:hypothetical protein
MGMFQNSKCLSQKRIPQLIRESCSEARKFRKEECEKLLDAEPAGRLGKVRKFLFRHGNTLSGFSLASCPLIWAICTFSNIPPVCALLLYAFLLVILILPGMFTPKFGLNQDSFWAHAWSNIASKIGKEEAEREIRSRIEYSEGMYQFYKIIIGIMVACSVGCISDLAFQNALLAINIENMYAANPLGTWCIICLPGFLLHGFLLYDAPIHWMRKIYNAGNGKLRQFE